MMLKTSSDAVANKKRKRSSPSGEVLGHKLNKPSKSKSTADTVGGDSIQKLEQQIQESQKYYNNIVQLISIAKEEALNPKSRFPAIISLCRVFSRLLVDGRLSRPKTATESEIVISDWLRQRYAEYKSVLLDVLSSSTSSAQNTAITLCIQLVQVEVKHGKQDVESRWRKGLFSELLRVLLYVPNASEARRRFVDDYFKTFDDVRHFTFMTIADCLEQLASAEESPAVISCALGIMLSMDNVPDLGGKLENIFCPPEESSQQKLISSSAHRKQAQRAWSALLNHELDKQQRKDVLQAMTTSIVPWLKNPELLMDFLTDSYNVGGATSLLSLSGLFHLMQDKNLDYPDFYNKLYSLLNGDLLHSKHRSRFFRLFHVFMSSTHLPAAMVASFIKRLSRLCLHAPPGGIVAVIPWVYNMLKTHPTCTFMIHREPRSQEERSLIDKEGFEDPFDMDEPDPMESGAIDSSLWELETLQSHYHPNVASLARIMSEQFTKQSYNLADFLDHSYNSLIEAELGKDMKKSPVVEFEIPKTIFTDASGDATLQELFTSVVKER